MQRPTVPAGAREPRGPSGLSGDGQPNRRRSQRPRGSHLARPRWLDPTAAVTLLSSGPPSPRPAAMAWPVALAGLATPLWVDASLVTRITTAAVRPTTAIIATASSVRSWRRPAAPIRPPTPACASQRRWPRRATDPAPRALPQLRSTPPAGSAAAGSSPSWTHSPRGRARGPEGGATSAPAGRRRQLPRTHLTRARSGGTRGPSAPPSSRSATSTARQRRLGTPVSRSQRALACGCRFARRATVGTQTVWSDQLNVGMAGISGVRVFEWRPGTQPIPTSARVSGDGLTWIDAEAVSAPPIIEAAESLELAGFHPQFARHLFSNIDPGDARAPNSSITSTRGLRGSSPRAADSICFKQLNQSSWRSAPARRDVGHWSPAGSASSRPMTG